MPKTRVNGIDMYYELHGDGIPVVLIQGLGGTHRFWEPNLPQLLRRCRILLLDYRGGGDTDTPDMPYSTRLFADDIAGLMDAVGMKQAHIVGRSMGGCIAQWLGIAHPQNVLSLILAATWGRADGMLRHTLASWTRFVELDGLPGLLDHILPWCWSRALFEPERAAELIALRQLVMQNRQPADGFRRQSLAGQEHNALAQLPAIRAPTLVMVGEDDILTPRKFAEELVERIPGAELALFPRLGHAFYEERPAVFNNAALGFWTRE
jgi:3-oxoadipate enol-lactonase